MASVTSLSISRTSYLSGPVIACSSFGFHSTSLQRIVSNDKNNWGLNHNGKGCHTTTPSKGVCLLVMSAHEWQDESRNKKNVDRQITMRNILFDWLRRIFYNIYKYAYVDCKKASRCSHEIKTSSNSHEALYTIKGSQLLTKTLMPSIMLAKYQLSLTLRIMFGIGGSWACTISNCISYRNFGGQCFCVSERWILLKLQNHFTLCLSLS